PCLHDLSHSAGSYVALRHYPCHRSACLGPMTDEADHSSLRGWRSRMTKKQNTRKSQSATGAATAAYGSLIKALGGLQSKLEIPESAREFVKRGAATAKQRAAAMHDGAN